MEAFDAIHMRALGLIPVFKSDWNDFQYEGPSPDGPNTIEEKREFEIYLLAITIGFLISMDLGRIPRSDDSVDRLIATCLAHNDQTLHLEWDIAVPLIRNRLSVFKRDLVGMLGSDYPQTKQYLPHTTCNIINYCPLEVEQDLSWAQSPTADNVGKWDMSSGVMQIMGNLFNNMLKGLQ